MIKELIKGFISVPIDLYNSITPHCFYMLGRIIGIFFVIFGLVIIFAIIAHIFNIGNGNNYDDIDFM